MLNSQEATMLGKRKRKPKPPEWMVVYTTTSAPEAHIVAGRLKHEGIPAMVHGEAGATAIGINIGNLGEIKVLVHPENYDDALDILEEEDLDELPESTDGIVYMTFDDEEDEDE
jgi:hypothetical protein